MKLEAMVSAYWILRYKLSETSVSVVVLAESNTGPMTDALVSDEIAFHRLMRIECKLWKRHKKVASK